MVFISLMDAREDSAAPDVMSVAIKGLTVQRSWLRLLMRLYAVIYASPANISSQLATLYGEASNPACLKLQSM
jgi:hypothetical protein